jgi:hypothetical protein
MDVLTDENASCLIAQWSVECLGLFVEEAVPNG